MIVMSLMSIPTTCASDATLRTVDSENLLKHQIETIVKGAEHSEKLIAQRFTKVTDLRL